MIWHPDILKMMRAFLLVLAILFLLSGTVMLALALGLHSPWYVRSAHLAVRYAVFFLGVAAVCALAFRRMGKGER